MNSPASHALPWQARLIRTALAICALLPLALLRLLANVLTPLVARLPLRENNVARRNIARCLPELTAREAASLHKASVNHLLMSLFELPLIWTQPWSKLKKHITSVEGEAEFRAAIAAAKQQSCGLILVAPHLGAWELLNLYLAEHTELAVLYRAPRKSWVEALLVGLRGRTRAIPVRAEPAAVRALLKRLQSGGVLGILPDQQPKRGEGEFAPFFGIDAFTMSLLPKLASRTGAIVLMAACVRVSGGFRIILRAPQPPLQDAASLNVNVERLARAHLPQYQWSYKRFSMRPHTRGEVAEEKFYGKQ